MSPTRTLPMVQWVFLSLGLAGLLGAGLLLVHTRNFVAHASHASGRVTDLVRRESSGANGGPGVTWAPQVQFADADGRPHEFVASSSSNPPSHRIGESVDVLFLPEQPENAAIDGFFPLWGGALIVGLFSGVFACIGAVMWRMRRRRARLDAWLLRNGRPVSAHIESTAANNRVSVNGRHPFYLTCQWQDPATSLVHVFRSENIWFDPAPYLLRDTATVYIDPRNPKRYYVDVSFLPRPA